MVKIQVYLKQNMKLWKTILQQINNNLTEKNNSIQYDEIIILFVLKEYLNFFFSYQNDPK